MNKKKRKKTIKRSNKALNKLENLDNVWVDYRGEYGPAKEYIEELIEYNGDKYEMKPNENKPKKSYKRIHSILSDNPFADYINESWFIYGSKMENTRYTMSITRSERILNRFIRQTK